MSKHTIEHLREHLFETLAGLRDKEQPLEIERAKAISEIAQTIINSAKVEVEHLRVVGGASETGFLPRARLPQKVDDTQTVEERPGVRIVTHRLK